jgi:hypothetical protein
MGEYSGSISVLVMNWLREVFKSRYVRMLEEENARLRIENRAVINSLLGVAGHGPVDFPAGNAAKTEARPRSNLSVHQRQLKTERESEQRIVARAAALAKPSNSDAA